MSEKKEVIYESKYGNTRIANANGFFFNGHSGLQVNWSAENFGFGSFTMGFDTERGKMCFDSEMMSREFVSKVMEKLIHDSLFTDFETAEKQVVSVNVEEANQIFAFKNNVFYVPFYEEVDETNSELHQMRWRLADDKVLNVWFDRKEIGEGSEAPFSFALTISKDKSFAKGFVKAEIWSWKITEKNNK